VQKTLSLKTIRSLFTESDNEIQSNQY